MITALEFFLGFMTPAGFLCFTVAGRKPYASESSASPQLTCIFPTGISSRYVALRACCRDGNRPRAIEENWIEMIEAEKAERLWQERRAQEILKGNRLRSV